MKSKWHQMSEEQKQQHLDGERRRRAERKAKRTPEQIAAISLIRKEQRSRRKVRDLAHHRLIAHEYKRNGKGWFYSWANTIKQRAAQKGVPCDIDAEWLQANLPSHCPVLGIELQRKVNRADNSAASPTVDRTIPALGYVRGNVHIISRRANNIKSDATAAEISRVAQWVESLS